MEQVKAKSKNGKSVLLSNPEVGDRWYALSAPVEKFVKNIEIGDDVDFRTSEDNGVEIISFISKEPIVDKKSGYVSTPASSVPTELAEPTTIYPPVTGYACKVCGASLKDGKYETCYTCSMKLRKEQASSPEEQSKQESIKRLAVGNATSRTMIAMQGKIDETNVVAVFNKIYDNILSKVNA